ncbi:MAG: hypothetical protein ACU0BF_03450 [Paracoccaceae bacterium]
MIRTLTLPLALLAAPALADQPTIMDAPLAEDAGPEAAPRCAELMRLVLSDGMDFDVFARFQTFEAMAEDALGEDGAKDAMRAQMLALAQARTTEDGQARIAADTAICDALAAGPAE